MTRILFIISFTFLVLAARNYFMLPDVYISHSTGECMKVVDYQGNKILNGCKNLPAKYDTVITR